MYYIHTIIPNLTDIKISTLTDPELYKNVFYEAIYFLPVFMFSVYFSIYFILPGYLKKRTFSFLILSFLLLAAVTAIACYLISKIYFRSYGSEWNEADVINQAWSKYIGDQIIITGSAIILKIIKDFSLKQRESEILAIENIKSKLQLLKMQMHPRILFECLQNIYNDIDAGTQYAPQMILKLSDLLSYLLYETDVQQIALSKEIKLIENYIELKELEYKKQLEICFKISGDTSTHYITPGLFLPLLEIGIVPFEKLNKVLVIFIELKKINSNLYFHLKNNMDGNQIMASFQSTLDSTKKRLQIFHSNKFRLDVHSSSSSLEINMQLQLNKIISLQNPNIQNDGE